MDRLEPGSIFAGHRIEAEAGRGGMGVVYRAVHLALERTVALKLIAPGLADEPGFRQRFRRESRLAAALDHPNVVPVYHAGEEHGLLYITMRFVEGTDLRTLLKSHGALEPQPAAEIAAKVAQALDAAHAAGLVHRDVKPANVLLGRDDGRVYLTDFGLTRREASLDALTNTGEWLGTVDFVAPEQINGRAVDARTDVYALGCVLFQMLAEVPPFRRDSYAAVVYAHLHDEPPSICERRPDVPAEMDAVIGKALAKEPGERFQTAGELGEAALAAAARARPSAAHASVGALAARPAEPDTDPARAVPTKRHERPRRSRRSLLATAAAAVLLALAIGLGLVVLLDGSDEEPLSADEVRGVLDRYVARYVDEDPDGIAALLAADFERRVGGGGPQSKDAAVARFRRIFSEPQAPRFVLSGMKVTLDGSGATARGRYKGEGRDLYGTGENEFHLRREAERVLIDKLHVWPDLNFRIPVLRESAPARAQVTVRTEKDDTLIAQRSFEIRRAGEAFYRVPLNERGRLIGEKDPYVVTIVLTDRDGRRHRDVIRDVLDR